jgi:hypothetical protein
MGHLKGVPYRIACPECRSLSLDWWNGLKSAVLARFLPINMLIYLNFEIEFGGAFCYDFVAV